MEAVLLIARTPSLWPHVEPFYDSAKNEIQWTQLRESSLGLSKCHRVALAWMRCIWMDSAYYSKWKDIFGSFRALDKDYQKIVLNAFAYRHNVFKDS